jgi:hypothetical protein
MKGKVVALAEPEDVQRVRVVAVVRLRRLSAALLARLPDEHPATDRGLGRFSGVPLLHLVWVGVPSVAAGPAQLRGPAVRPVPEMTSWADLDHTATIRKTLATRQAKFYAKCWRVKRKITASV